MAPPFQLFAEKRYKFNRYYAIFLIIMFKNKHKGAEYIMDIAFIAPYDSMRGIAQSVIEAKGYPARAYMGNMEAGVKETRKALHDGAKIIISRGGTARLIREKLGIDVIEVGASIYRVLAYIHEHTSPDTRIAVVGFRPFLSLVQPVCDILKRTSASFELGAAYSHRLVFDKVETWEPDVIIGDAVAERMAQGRLLPFHLIESTVETLTEAFERGMLVLNNLKRHLSNTEKLSAVLNCTQEGAMLVNAFGGIEEINRRGCELLRTSREAMIGASFRHVFASRELDAAMQAKTALKNAVVAVNGTPFALDLAIISPQAEINSAVILFQKVEHLQATESSIRMKLLDKGFYAKYRFSDIIFQSEAMRRALAMAREYSLTDCNIMIQGETGVGKELFAQSIHNAGPLAGGPFVAINCAALPGTLLESELFGYAPGAFTGALRSGKAGLFEMAHGGTLFLDEITEMDIFLQSRLLRALQTKEIMRVGDSRFIPINVRVIAASNRDPAQAMREGALRPDLFFRLNVLDLAIPPLREREGDPAFLFAHYLEQFEKKQGVHIPRPSRRFLQQIDGYAWPGNVRELENLAEKYVILRGLPEQQWDVMLHAETRRDAPAAARPGKEDDCEKTLDAVIDQHIKAVLEKNRGNISRTAACLGVNRNTVKRRLALERNKPLLRPRG